MLKTAIVLLVLAGILWPPIKTIMRMGWDLHFYTQHPGKCSIVKRPGTGSEDFQIMTSGLTFVTTGLTMPMASPDAISYVISKGKGSIQLIDMNNPSSGAKALAMKHGADFNPDIFRPHGLSVLEDKVKGEHLLYVINHAEGQADRVEKFRFLPKTKELKHEKSIFSDVFRITNDLVVVEEDKFYITNYLYFSHNKITFLEHMYQFPPGGVLFYNGTGITTLEDRFFSPNSVILSPDKRYLYVAFPWEKNVRVYTRKSDYDLELVQEVNVYTSLDNFHWAENGDSLYGGCHPIAYKALGHMSHPADHKAPSQVIHLPLKNGLIVEKDITQQFYDQGDLISGSSVAGVYKNKMLIGSVLDTLVVCDLPQKSSG